MSVIPPNLEHFARDNAIQNSGQLSVRALHDLFGWISGPERIAVQQQYVKLPPMAAGNRPCETVEYAAHAQTLHSCC